MYMQQPMNFELSPLNPEHLWQIMGQIDFSSTLSYSISRDVAFMALLTISHIFLANIKQRTIIL